MEDFLKIVKRASSVNRDLRVITCQVVGAPAAVWGFLWRKVIYFTTSQTVKWIETIIVITYWYRNYSCEPRMRSKLGNVRMNAVSPVPTRLCHVIYDHGDKKYPCLV